MARKNTFLYLVDGITEEKAAKLRKALLISERIEDVNVKLNSGVVSIVAAKDPETELKMACTVAGCIFRMKVSKRKAAYWA